MKHVFIMVVVPASLLIPLTAGSLNRVYKQRPLKPIYSYLFLAVVTELAARVLGARGVNNLPLLHFYTIVEFLLVMRFFMLVSDATLISKLAGWLMPLFVFFCVLDFTVLQRIYQFNSYPRAVGALVIAGFCLNYFYRKSDAAEPAPWKEEPLNWVVSGLLIYFGSSFFDFAFQNVLYERASLMVNYIFAYIHAALVMVMYLLFTTGFVYARRR